MALPAKPEEAGARLWTAGLWKAGLLLGGLAAAGLALRGLNAGMLRQAHPTFAGAVVLVSAGGLLAAVGVPRQAVAFAGGYAFGAPQGGALALLAQLGACAADFWWARAVARDWARRFLAGRLGRVDLFLARHPFSATLTLRLLPVGNNLALNLLAGVSGVRPWPFFAASALGYVPQTAVFALVGSGAQLGRGVQLAVGIGLFVASAGLGTILLRRARRGTVPPEVDSPHAENLVGQSAATRRRRSGPPPERRDARGRLGR